MNRPYSLDTVWGELLVSRTAEERPDKVKKLVYVSAFLLRDQECMVDIIQTDAEALLAPNLALSSDGVYTGINVDRVQDIFYGCCQEEEDMERAKISLTPQPMNVLSIKLSLTPERFGQIPRTYIECLCDRSDHPFPPKNNVHGIAM
jgi:pimeloyl-ACP methyl ester carboxylesterase